MTSILFQAIYRVPPKPPQRSSLWWMGMYTNLSHFSRIQPVRVFLRVKCIRCYTLSIYANFRHFIATGRLKKGFGGQDFELADFAFISFLAYTSEINTQNFLDHWYGTLPTGESIATNNDELIDEFKNSPEYEEYIAFGSAVSYKLVTFEDPKYPGAILTSEKFLFGCRLFFFAHLSSLHETVFSISSTRDANCVGPYG